MMRQEKKICPVCVAQLEEVIHIKNSDDSIWVNCSRCGTYVMSQEFYEDYIEPERDGFNQMRLARFLEAHKQDKDRPFLTIFPVSPPDGYRCYPYHVCVLSEVNSVRGT